MLRTEQEVLSLWDSHSIFEASVVQNKKNPLFTFLDGPPFATGTMHWGHVMISQFKDTVLRYKTQQGYHVPRRWGWDTHGVPVEAAVEKQLKIKDRREIEDVIGIAEFNKACREIVFQYDLEWRKTIHRVGRWVDFDDQYRTLDNEFCESVWWGLSQLWKKNLLYKSYRTSLYSPSAGVPLSHTDSAMEVKYVDETVESPVVRFGADSDKWRILKDQILNQVEQELAVQKQELHEAQQDLASVSKPAKRFSLNLSLKKPNNELQGDVEEHLEVQEAKERISILQANIETLEVILTTLHNHQPLNILAWTTTPWTLPSNSALAVGSDITYSIFYLPATEEFVLVGEKRAIPILSLLFRQEVLNNPNIEEKLKHIEDSSEYFRALNIDIIKIASISGNDLIGMSYKPPFEPVQKIKEYEKRAALFHIYTADFVTDGEGTGIIHIAPYGEDDYTLITKHNLPFLLTLNEHGEVLPSLNPSLTPVFGKHYEEANPLINQILEKEGKLFGSITYTHRVPMFDRDGKKLIQFPLENWFIAETEFKPRSLELNEKISWFPEHVKHGRFGKGLESAPDWSISRNRYWGNPLPIWQTEDKSKTIFVGSIEELSNKAINPFFVILNSRDLNPSYYAQKRTVIFGDSQSKLPLGINASQHRSKHLYELRQQKNLTIHTFAPYAQKMLDEILELFEKYQAVQTMFTDEERVLWTTWVQQLHPDSKKASPYFYFYRGLEQEVEGWVPVGAILPFDVHRPYIDQILLTDEVGNVYKRIPEVMDCWVESGSMPWASWHYPFENKELVERNSPADWIIEAQDQTRGWFRTLHVLSTAIWDVPAFKNVNCTGLILASDGNKMSKSKKNFADPVDMLEKYGSDANRLYILSSPVTDGESFKFIEKDLDRVFKASTLLLSNSLQYVTYVTNQYGRVVSPKSIKHPLNIWFVAHTKEVMSQILIALEKYDVGEACRQVVPFLDSFSTWYIRRSKDILKTNGSEVAATLLYVLRLVAITCASIQPFNMEKVWSAIRGVEDPISVHLTKLLDITPVDAKERVTLIDMELVQGTVSEIHNFRKRAGYRVRQPMYVDMSELDLKIELKEMILQECNLIERSLANVEGQVWKYPVSQEAGTIIIDCVIDEELELLGLARDFERMIQDWRKKQGMKPNSMVNIEAFVVEIRSQELLSKVLARVDWDKLKSVLVIVEEENEGASIEIKNMGVLHIVSK